MTQEEINDYNRRCAEFLGLKRGWWISQQKPLTDDKKQWCDLDGKTFLGSKVYFDKDLKFHSDWNWIMKVVEDIEELGYQFDITGNEVGVNSNIMSMENISTGGTMNSYNRSYYPTIISICEEDYSKKEAVVQAINQFLIWYNEQRT